MAAVVIFIVMITTMTTPAATAQLPEEVGQPDRIYVFEADPEATNFALGIATSVLWNLTDRAPSVSFSEDGTMSIVESFNTEKGLVIISVSAPHNLTPENGYVYDNNLLYAPNGTQIFP